MKKRFCLCTLILLFAVMLGTVHAATTYSDLGSWETAVGSWSNYTYYGANDDTINTLTLDQSITFTPSVAIRTIGDGWATWSGGYTGQVLYTNGYESVSGLFASGSKAFGFEIEPDAFSLYNITLTLSDGTFLTQSVSGQAGAKFFGWTSTTAIDSFTITCAGDDFAFGNFYTGSETPVPEPCTMLLLGSGLAGIAAFRRKFKRA